MTPIMSLGHVTPLVFATLRIIATTKSQLGMTMGPVEKPMVLSKWNPGSKIVLTLARIA
jgi:hypothetical protein